VTHVVEIASAALRFRDLQHSHATRLVGAGLPVSVIQKGEGTQDPTTPRGDLYPCAERQRRHLAHVERLRAMPYPWEQLIK